MFPALFSIQVSVGIPFAYDEQSSYDYDFLDNSASIGIGAKAVAGATAFLRNGVRAKAFLRGQTSDATSYTLDRANFNTATLQSGANTVIGGSIGAYLNNAKEEDDSFFTTSGNTNTFLFGH